MNSGIALVWLACASPETDLAVLDTHEKVLEAYAVSVDPVWIAQAVLWVDEATVTGCGCGCAELVSSGSATRRYEPGCLDGGGFTGILEASSTGESTEYRLQGFGLVHSRPDTSPFEISATGSLSVDRSGGAMVVRTTDLQVHVTDGARRSGTTTDFELSANLGGEDVDWSVLVATLMSPLPRAPDTLRGTFDTSSVGAFSFQTTAGGAACPGTEGMVEWAEGTTEIDATTTVTVQHRGASGCDGCLEWTSDGGNGGSACP